MQPGLSAWSKHFLLSVTAILLAWPGLPWGARAGDQPNALHLNLRTRVELFKGSGDWTEVSLRKQIPLKETAILICDMWDKHWCPSASNRCAALAEKMAKVIANAQTMRIPVIHAPSE